MIICKQTIFIVKCPFELRIAESIATHLTEQPSTTSLPHRDCFSLPPTGDSFLCCQCFGGIAREPDSSKFTFLDFVWKRSFVSFWGVPEKVKCSAVKINRSSGLKKHIKLSGGLRKLCNWLPLKPLSWGCRTILCVFLTARPVDFNR